MGIMVKLYSTLALAFIAQYIFSLYISLGYVKKVYHHPAGSCHLVPGVEDGSEDLQTLSDGTAIITSGLKYGAVAAHPVLGKRKGALYKFDFNNPEEGVKEIKIKGYEIDNPHGISLWEDTVNGGVTAFVVNHKQNGEHVEKLNYDRKQNVLTHLESIAHSTMTCLNDVVATGPHSFYVTNNGGCSLMPEVFFPIKRGNTIYCEATNCRVVASQQTAPNGINISPNGRLVYVANPFGESIEVYKRDSNNDLKFSNKISLGSLPDNIDVSKKDGSLWVGCNPITYKTAQAMEDPSNQSPTQVLRLKVDGDGQLISMNEVHSDKGHLIHTSTIASYYQGAMLVGSISHKLMYCQVAYLPD